MLSIIVPVYNAEKYLNRCIESIIKQKNIDFELLLIDDGSRDRSGEICDYYKKIDNRIYVIHKKNAGVVAARNVGIKISRGEFISFVDSDDWLDEDYYSYYIPMFTNDIDVIISGAVLNEKEIIFDKGKTIVMTSEEAMEKMFQNKIFGWELWGKIYRLEVLRKIDFDININIGEDLDANWQIVRRVNKILYDPERSYHYRKNYDGVMLNYMPLQSNFYIVYHRIMDDGGLKIKKVSSIIFSGYLKVMYARIRELFFYKPDKYEYMIKKHIDEIIKYSSEIVITPNNIDEKYRILLEGYQKSKTFFRHLFNKFEESIFEAYKGNRVDYVYGTGVVSRYVSHILEKRKWPCRAYIVSNGEHKRNCFCGKPVYYIDSIRKDACILVAVGDKKALDIVKKLKENNYSQINIVSTSELF